MFTRRYLLASALAFPLIFPIYARAASWRAEDACLAKIRQLFPRSLPSARALGKLCLPYCGTARSAAQLMDEMCSEPGERAQLAAAAPGEIRSWLDAKIRRDFAMGRTVRIDGWVLSHTEARLFAVLAAG